MSVALSIAGLMGGSLLSTIGATSVACSRASEKKDGTDSAAPAIIGALLTAGGVGLTAFSGYALGQEKKKKPNPRTRSEALTEAFKGFHWGDPPTEGLSTHELPDTGGGVFSLGRLRAVEYEAKKGGRRDIYRHEFKRPWPHITGTLDGRLGPIVGGRARVHDDGIID